MRCADYDAVARALPARFGALPELKTFRGEICRPELLAEMEGMIEQRRDVMRCADYDAVPRALPACFGALPELKIFRGEICRPELLVEMEGMIEHRREGT